VRLPQQAYEGAKGQLSAVHHHQLAFDPA